MHLNKLPLVTIGVATYNQSVYLSILVESIMNQTYSNWELIIFDDCSQDESELIIQPYLKDKRITFIKNETNLGLFRNWTQVFKSGQGKYFLGLGGDDYLHHTYLEALVPLLEQNPDSVLAYTPTIWVNENGDFIKESIHMGHTSQSYIGGRNEIADLLVFDNYINPSATLVRKSALDSLDVLLEPNMDGANDWLLWIKMANINPDFIFCRESLVYYRIHPKQYSSQFYNTLEPLEGHIKVLEKTLLLSTGLTSIAPRKSEILQHLLRRYEIYKDTEESINLKPRIDAIKNIFEKLSYALPKLTMLYPLVSIIITTYNRRALLPYAIESVLTQTYQNFEIIVVNDCGENVSDIIASYNNSKIRLLNHRTNSGLPFARNTALRVMSGDIVCFLDDDDLYRSTHLETIVKAYVEKNAAVVYTDSIYADEIITNNIRNVVSESNPFAEIEYSKERLFIQNFIPVNAWSCRFDALKEVSYFDESLHSMEDWELLIRLSQKFDFFHISLPTVEVRRRVDVVDNMLRQRKNQFYDIYKKIYDTYDNMGNLEIQKQREAILNGLLNNKQPSQKLTLNSSKNIIAYLADPFDTDNYLDLTLNILSPIANLKDYTIEPLLQKNKGRYHIKTELLGKAHAVIIYDKAAYFSHLIPQIKACGIPVLFYIHTDVWHVDVKHSQKEALDLLQRHYSSCIELADGIVTSNEHLSRDIAKANDVITPLLDTSPWNTPIEKSFRYSDKFTIAVYVDMTNLNDISMITKFIQTIQKKYADELYFVIHAINCPSNELEALSFVDVRLTKIDNYLQYIHFIRSQNVDAVLVPLIANEHNLTVSPLNYFIQSLCGIPGIYSNWGLYKEVVQHGVTGFLCAENELDWEAAVVTLMHHSDTRQQIADAAKKQVRDNFTTDHILRQVHDLFGRFTAPDSPRTIPDTLKKSFTRYELKSYLSYPVWCETKALQPIDLHVWDALSQNWHEMIDFHFFVHVNETNLSDLADTIESFIAQLYPRWNLYIISPIASPNALFDEHEQLHWIQTEASLYSAINHVSAQMNTGMIGFLTVGDKLLPHALTAYADMANHSDCHLIYSDHDSLNKQKNRIHPQFKPDFNLDMFRSYDYISRSFVISSVALKELGGLQLELSDSELFDLILRYLDRFKEYSIGHYSDVLHSLVSEEKIIDLRRISSKIALIQHLDRNKLNADVIEGTEESFRILYHHESAPLVSIIIPTKNQVHFLCPCIETLMEKTAYKNYEIIIIDNHSDETDAVAYLKSLAEYDNIHVIAYNKPFNYSAANNLGAQHARGEFLLLLNNDTEVLHENWLDVLLSYAQRDDIGIVGPRLIYPNQTIQHAGVIIGLNSCTDHSFKKADLEDPGYIARLQIDQNLSAVTAAAMLIKRSVFDAVAGLNEIDYNVNFSDVDLCLKVIEAGYKILFTPHATLLHHGGVSQNNIHIKKTIEHSIRFSDDRKAFKTRWAEIILHDPAYNVNLDTADSFMPIRTQALAHWNPLLKSTIPKIFGMARGKDGGGFYRIISPLNALQAADLAQTHYEYKNFMATYVMMQQPDIIVYQTPLHDNMISFLEDIKMYYPKVTLIYEIDDLLTNIPIDNRAFFNQYKNTAKRLMKGLKYCDRLVVSTQPLKDALEPYIDDIRIIPNYLSKSIWGSLRSQRNRSAKLRVGWAGSIFHKGDLAIISKLLESYQETVEWVFFGMAPEGLEGKIEFHPGVSLDQYPEKLASLDLDLALVPLEDNAFNAAKSNLRLLEFGILGWPVICSDVYPYREAPVTRVKNRYKDWEKAFLSKISDVEGLKTEGNKLKDWVEKNYILEDNVDFIYQQYTNPTKNQ
jgi:glycosyltransferase involved in cell wall biosynthesis